MGNVGVGAAPISTCSQLALSRKAMSNLTNMWVRAQVGVVGEHVSAVLRTVCECWDPNADYTCHLLLVASMSTVVVVQMCSVLVQLNLSIYLYLCRTASVIAVGRHMGLLDTTKLGVLGCHKQCMSPHTPTPA